METLFLTLPREFAAVIGSTGRGTRIAPRTHKVRRIPNPLGKKGDWLVLEETVGGLQLGAALCYWQQFSHVGVRIDTRPPFPQ